jgi:ParB-like chromosome segregation protein Spo0J
MASDVQFELTQQEVAEAVGKSRTTVTNLLRLMSLSHDVRLMLERGDLEMGHARALLGLPVEQQSDAAKSVRLDHLNAQGQPQFVWPTTFALAGAYLDQLERSGGLSASQIGSTRQDLADAERASGASQREALTRMADELSGEAGGSNDADKVRMLSETVRELGR